MRRRGLSLVEVIVSLGLAGILLALFAGLYRSAGKEFETGTSTVVLTQTARLALEKITPYVSCALPPATGQNFIYSPTTLNCSERTDVYPNIYSLDFLTCVDFLNPNIDDPANRYVGYTNRRGTGPRNRYRVSYDPAQGMLWLEKLSLTSPAPPALPTVLAPLDTNRRLLGRNLNRVTFERVELGINVRISARTTDAQGKLREGLTGKDGRTLNPDQPGTPRHLQAREYELFTTVLIPYFTSR